MLKLSYKIDKLINNVITIPKLYCKYKILETA